MPGGSSDDMDRGFCEISDALVALAARPNDPDAPPDGLIRLVRLMSTLAEPDDVVPAV